MTYKIIRLDQTGSTNIYAQTYAQEHKNIGDFIVIAQEQTAGRGQRGNSWFAEKGKNLTFSVVKKNTGVKAGEFFNINLVVSLAVFHTIIPLVKQVKIKWSNDIFICKKKIAGILIENTLRGNNISQSIIGIGLNINQEFFPTVLSQASSLFIETHKNHDLNTIFKSFIHHFDIFWEKKTKFDTLKQFYIENLFAYRLWQNFKDKNGYFSGQIIDIERTGQLVILDKKNKIRRYFFKELVFLIN